MTLASQSSNAEFAQAGFVVKREKEQMDIVSMYYKKLKEAQAEVACNEVSQKCDGKECQANVSFVEFFEAMDALTKNFFWYRYHTWYCATFHYYAGMYGSVRIFFKVLVKALVPVGSSM